MSRGMGWDSESVRALNIIDVIYSDDDRVRSRWKEYYCQLCIQNPYIPKGMIDAMQQQQIIQNGQEKWASAVDLFTKAFGSDSAQPVEILAERKEDAHANP